MSYPEHKNSIFAKTEEDINLPKTERGEKTYNKLLDTAEQIFGEKGYYNTSIIDITQEAGVAQGTFYIYFPNKKSIFRALIIHLSHSLRRELAISIQDSETRMEIERKGMATFFSFIEQHTNLYKIVWQAQFVDPEIFREYYETVARNYKKALKKAIQKNEIRDLDPELLVYSLIGISNFIGLRWIIWENNPLPGEKFEDLMSFIAHGMEK